MAGNLSGQTRRSYLKKSATTAFGGALFGGTASAVSRGWSVYTTGADSQRIVAQEEITSTTTYEDDYKKTTYGENYLCGMGGAVRAEGWGTPSANGNYDTRIYTCASSLSTYDNRIEKTTHSTTWEGGNLVAAANNSNYIGGYDGGNYEHDVSDITKAIANAAVSSLTGTAVSLSSLAFPGSAIFTSIAYAALTSAGGGNNSYNRIWNWGGKEQTSIWTEYLVDVNSGQSMLFDQAQLTDIAVFGDVGTMYSGFAVNLSPPDDINLSGEQSFSDLASGNYNKYALLKKKRKGKRDLYVSSGKYARENPDEFPMPNKEIRNLDHDATVIRAKVNMNTRQTGQEPSDISKI